MKLVPRRISCESPSRWTVIGAAAFAVLHLTGGCSPPDAGSAGGEETSSEERSAQGGGGSGSPTSSGAGEAEASPVMSSLVDYMGGKRESIVAAASKMPAESYGFSPTEGTMTFREQVAHVVQLNNFLCKTLSGDEAPDPGELHGAEKQALVDALDSSFEFCQTTLAGVTDADLSEMVPFFGGNESPKGYAALALAADWANHYGHLATYLRLNGMLPPTAEEGSTP